MSQQEYFELLRRELDLKRAAANGDVAARGELARRHDAAKATHAAERERRRQAEYDRLGIKRG